MIHEEKERYSKSLLIIEIMMILISLLMIVPIVYLFVSSFKTKAEINRPLALPSGFYVQNYIDAVKTGDFFTLLSNSVVVSSIVILLIVTLGSLAAYPLSRRKETFFKIIYFVLKKIVS